mmetsp:Transcript_10223/g.22687  ORF Transcript_10223/g.22687 Transcript_10223/m.22687 type:complete len:333 (-) Transcript_10223:121-1119(-)
MGQGVGAHSPSGLGAVLRVLRRDPGVQELTPYLSRFFYQQIRANTKRLLLLRTVVRAVQALLGNERVALDFHLQQLLPAALTCGVAARLGAMPGEDHWSLRSLAAEVVAQIARKFHTKMPDLHQRVCKTYMDALGEDVSLPTLFGGLEGIRALGRDVVRTLLLSRAPGTGGSGGGSCLLARIDQRLSLLSSSTAQAGGAHASLDAAALERAAGTVGVSVSGGKRAREGEEVQGRGQGQGQAQAQIESNQEQARIALTRRTRTAAAQQQLAVGMCQEALVRALGRSVAHNARLPKLRGARGGVGGIPLCGLEEQLVPYYASAAKQDYYCRLMI